MRLDQYTLGELYLFAKSANRNRPIAFARALFPNKPEGYVRATQLLGHYAFNRAVHIEHPGSRVPVGDKIGSYQDIAERIYQRLPDYAKEMVR